MGADAIVARITCGKPVDVIFLAANVLDDLVKEGLVTASSRIDIAPLLDGRCGQSRRAEA